MQAADWKQPEKHTSDISLIGKNAAVIRRHLDSDQYAVTVNWANLARVTNEKPHEFTLGTDNGRKLEFTVSFSQHANKNAELGPIDAFSENERHWQRFWTDGAAVDFTGSSDKRAPELERRVILSQYLTAIQCSGSMPPQETGLTCNSWYGKFHLE